MEKVGDWRGWEGGRVGVMIMDEEEGQGRMGVLGDMARDGWRKGNL
jgi:hypothetical protein